MHLVSMSITQAVDFVVRRLSYNGDAAALPGQQGNFITPSGMSYGH